jgi:uncharacterized protein (DUF302 family)
VNSMAVGVTRVIPESFDKSVALIRRVLGAAGFTIVGEFDISREPYFQLGIASRSCVVLLVDTPVLLFEAIALDRTAAAFLPLHVVISGDRDTSYVHWADPVAISGLRPPAPARGALDEAYRRVTATLSEVSRAQKLNLASRTS